MTTPPSKQLDQFVIRLPDGMRGRIKAAAEANNRSMNAEIVATLEDVYPATPDDFSAAFAAVFADGVTREAQLLSKMVRISREADGTVKVEPLSGQSLF